MSNERKEKLLAAVVLTAVAFLFSALVLHSVAISALVIGIGVFIALVAVVPMQNWKEKDNGTYCQHRSSGKLCRCIASAMAVLCILISLPLSTVANDYAPMIIGNQSVDKIAVSGEADSVIPENGSYKIKATDESFSEYDINSCSNKTYYKARQRTLTFTNNYNGWVKITYTIDDNGTLAAGTNCTVADGVITVQSKGTFTIAVTSSSNTKATAAASKTCTFSPSAIEYEPLTPEIIFAAPGENGAFTIADADGNAVAIGSIAESSSYTLTAKPDTNYAVFRWIFTNSSGVVTYFGEKTNTLTYNASEPGTITCEFMRSGSAIYTVDGVKIPYFDDALTAACTTKQIVLVSTGAMYGHAGQTEFTIPNGVQLVLPYAEGKTTVEGSGADFPYANFLPGTSYSGQPSSLTSSRYLELTIPFGTTVKNNGVISVGGTIQGNGVMNGAHSNLKVDGTLELKANTSVLSAVGYVHGSGSVVANGSGAKIYQPLSLYRPAGWGWSNATAGGSMGGGMITWPDDGYSGVNPAIRYTTQAIQCHFTMTSGDTMYGYADQHEAGKHWMCTVTLIGSNKDSSLIALNQGATLNSNYDSSKTSTLYTTVGKQTLEISGGATQGTIKLEMSGYTLALSSWPFPVPYNYDIILKNGTYDLQFDLSLLPGAGLTVDSTATLNVPSGVHLAVFTGANDHGTSPKGDAEYPYEYPEYTKTYNGGTTASPWYPVNSTLSGPSGGTMMANLVVNGTLDVKSGAYFGGVVQTNGTGTVIMNGNTGRFTRQMGLTGHAKEVSSLDKTKWTSAGATIYEFYPQYFDESGVLQTMESGKVYGGSNANTNAIETFTYDLYTSSADVSLKETHTETINATATGQWHICDFTAQGDLISAGNCVTKAKYKAKCTICSYVNGEIEGVVNSSIHTGNNHTENAADATCDKPGYTGDTVCECGVTVQIGSEIPATGHTYEATVTEPTCTKGGYTTYTCACGDTYTGDATEATGHSYEAVVTAPTCEGKGYTTHTCSACGDTYKDDYVDALGHTEAAAVKENEVAATCGAEGSYDNVVYCSECDEKLSSETVVLPATGEHTYGTWIVTTPATCEGEGVETKTCSGCGDKQTRPIEATGHNMQVSTTVDPTCSSAGSTTYTCANGCGKTETTTTGEALGHKYDAVVTAPTCTAKGYTTHTCSVCGDKYTDSETAALGHTEAEAVREKEIAADYNKAGSYDEVVYCSVCGEELSRKTVVVPQLEGEASVNGTNYKTLAEALNNASNGNTVVLLKDVTAAEVVNAYGKTLDLNGKTLTGAVVGTVKMNKGTLKTYSDPAYTGGVVVTYTMAGPVGSGAKYITDDAVFVLNADWSMTVTAGSAALGESWQTLPGQKVTIGAAAKVAIPEGMTFTVRGEVFVEGELTCEGTIVLENANASLTAAEGLNVILADGIGDTVLYANGKYVVHSHTEETVPGYAATCTETGLTEGKKCSVCGEVLTAQETIPALGHTKVIDAAKAPTCTETGLTEGKHCSVCGEILIAQEEVAALGHSYDDGVVTTAPTCTEDGVKTFTCNCGHTYTEAIAATGHTEEIIAAVAPTCTATGLTEGKKCSVCGEILVAQETVAATGHSFTNYVSNNDATFDKDGTKTAKCDRCDVTDTITDEGTKLTAVAKIGDQRYESLAEAVAAAESGATVTLLTDAIGAGVVINKDITIDFDGKTYTLNKAVGSAGTETLGFQILKGHNVTLKNGTLTSTAVTDGKEVKVLIQNYSNLTLTDMNLVDNTEHILYALSNNSGNIALNGATSIDTDAVAFDVYDYSSAGYAVPSMSVNTTGRIAGKIEVSETATLAISGGTFTVELDQKWCAKGYAPNKNQDGTYGVHIHVYYAGVVTAPTCTEEGYTTYTCQNEGCDHSYVDDQVAALGHTGGEAVRENEVAATCETEGSYDEVIKCSVCGKELSRNSKTIDKLPHTEVIDEAVDATCTEAGKTEGKHCSVCGEVIVEQEEISAKGHTEVAIGEAKDATCTEDGITAGVKCSVCGAIIVEQEEIPAKGHTEETIPGKAATCTETGLTEGVKCSVCDKVLAAQTEIPMVAHTEEIVPGKAATCTETGLTDGVKCSVCNEVLTAQEEIPMAAHTEEIVPGKAATCTETGLTDGVKCSVCGTTLTAQTEIPANDHSWDDGTITTEPTLDTEGVKTYVCTVCEETKTESVPAIKDTVLASGYCGAQGENLSWVLTGDGTLTISGEGAMATYINAGRAPWYSYRTSITAVVVEDGATTIGRGAFNECTALERASISASVTSIEMDAFRYCKALTAVTIPADSKLEMVGNQAFYTCTSLTSIDLPDSVTTIDAYAFNDCKALTNITIPANVTTIGKFAFSGCVALEEVTFEGSPSTGFAETIFNALGTVDAPVTVYYPADNADWTEDIRTETAYGAKMLEWKPYCTGNHSYKAEVTEPTCTEAGYTTYTCACGDSYTDDEVDALGHSYDGGVVSTEPDCETEGVRTYTCECGHSYTETIEATGHDWDEGVVTTEPTCTEAGVKTYTCSCDDSYTEEIEALGHNLMDVVAKDATCTEDGYTAYKDCSRCDYVEGKTEIPATGHSYGEPTWDWTGDDENGYTAARATFTCAVCEEEDGTETVTDEEIEEDRTEATATTDGSIVYTASVVLGEKTYTATKEITIPATGGGVEEEKFVPTIGNGTTVGKTNDDGSVTFQAGTSNAAPTVTVNAPTDGWKLGEENIFTVSSTDDVACVVLVKDANGEYHRLTATTSEGVHSFSATIDEGDEIVVAIKGDINCDGLVNVEDESKITRALLDKNHRRYKELNDFEYTLADHNNSGEVNVEDESTIKRALLDSNHRRYKAFIW